MEQMIENLQPREKLLQCGAAALTDAEILALFLRTGASGVPVLALAQQLIDHFGSFYRLMTASRAEFDSVKGVGDAKYAQLNAIAELARRFYTCHETLANKTVGCATDILHYLYSQLSHREREIFMVIFFDNQNRIIHSCEMFSGTISSVEVHPREIVREALKHNAAGIILSHNHPSGVSTASMADRDVTHQISSACKLLNITVLDHIVIGRGEYVSFAESGWL